MTAANIIAIAPRYARVGREQLDSVLAALARGATLAAACAECGASYAAVWARVQRDEDFAAEVDEARARFHKEVIATAYKLAVTGVDRPKFNKDGDVVGVERRYSERVLLRLLGTIPEYRESKVTEHKGEVVHSHTHATAGAISVELLRSLPFATQIEIRKAMIEDAHKRGHLTEVQRLERMADLILDARERGHDIGDERTFAALPHVVDVDAVEVSDDESVFPI